MTHDDLTKTNDTPSSVSLVRVESLPDESYLHDLERQTMTAADAVA